MPSYHCLKIDVPDIGWPTSGTSTCRRRGGRFCGIEPTVFHSPPTDLIMMTSVTLIRWRKQRPWGERKTIVLFIFSRSFSLISILFRNFALAFRKECKDILLNRLSITTWENEQTPFIGTVPPTGAAFPYLGVACGEPRAVWRKSAPLVFRKKSN